jgi:hypothetical protein
MIGLPEYDLNIINEYNKVLKQTQDLFNLKYWSNIIETYFKDYNISRTVDPYKTDIDKYHSMEYTFTTSKGEYLISIIGDTFIWVEEPGKGATIKNQFDVTEIVDILNSILIDIGELKNDGSK